MPEATINGFKHYWEDLGSGEALLMLHGASASGKQFEDHFSELSKRLRIIVPDMRAMGRSEHVSTIPPSAWTDDAGALLDHLGIERCAVYGSSLGARVALRFAADNPQRVSCLILDNPIIANESGGNQALNARLGNPDSLPPAAQQRNEAMHGADWRDVVRAYFAIRNEPELQEYYNLREAAKRVETPALITRGDSREDVTHPFAHVFELGNSLKNSRIWVKPEGGCLATAEGYDVVANWVTQNAKQAVGA